MNNNTTKFEYKQINSKFILSDPAYQRTVDMSRVRLIVANFNKDLVNPAKVSFRGGKYYVFDGQHTLAALKLKNNNEDLMVDCKVYTGLSQADEAILFSQQNGISRTVESIAKFKALYASGDIDIREFHDLTNKSGVRMDFTKGGAENKIVACSKAYKIYKSVLASDYIDILSIVKNAWGGVKESFSTEILGGIYIFYKTYKGEFDRKLLISQLGKVSPLVIVREGKAYSGGGDERFARQMYIVYNKQLRTHRLADKF